MTWVPDRHNQPPKFEIEHLDGVEWLNAPLPHRLHICKAQTRGYTNWIEYVERCACGSIRLDQQGRWMERNAREAKKSKGSKEEG